MKCYLDFESDVRIDSKLFFVYNWEWIFYVGEWVLICVDKMFS